MDYVIRKEIVLEDKMRNGNNENCIVVSGQRACIPDILLLLKSIYINFNLNNFDIVYFFYEYEKSDISLIHQMFPKVHLVDVSCLIDKYSFIKNSKLIYDNFYGPCLFIKILCIKYLCFYKTLVYLDRDTYVLKDFCEIIEECIGKNADAAAWEFSKNAQLIEVKSFNINQAMFDEFDKRIAKTRSHSRIVRKPNSGVLFLFHSILSKINIDELFNVLNEIFLFQFNYSDVAGITDEDVLWYIFTRYDINLYSLDAKFNFIPQCFSLPITSSTTIEEEFVSEFDDIFILHMTGSDKRSPYIAGAFPEIEQGRISLANELKILAKSNNSVKFVYEELSRASPCLSAKGRISQLMRLKNDSLYRNFSVQIFEFVKNSRFFYIEPLRTDLVFMLFIKNTDQRNRLLISAHFFDIEMIRFDLRIYVEKYLAYKYKSYPDLEHSSFIADVKEFFSNYQIETTSRFLYIRIIVRKSEFLSSMFLLESLFDEHKKELYGCFF